MAENYKEKITGDRVCWCAFSYCVWFCLFLLGVALHTGRKEFPGKIGRYLEALIGCDRAINDSSPSQLILALKVLMFGYLQFSALVCVKLRGAIFYAYLEISSCNFFSIIIMIIIIINIIVQAAPHSFPCEMFFFCPFFI